MILFCVGQILILSAPVLKEEVGSRTERKAFTRTVKAIPHKDSAADALSDFSSDCTEIPKAY